MAKYCLKKPSKRKSSKKKFKIAKKVREHDRKMKKEAKKSREGRIMRGEIIHIPNKCPFKLELLDEMMKQSGLKETEDWRTQAEKKRQKQSAKRKKLRANNDKSQEAPPAAVELDVDMLQNSLTI